METIKKIGENHVVVENTKEITETEEYGQERIDKEKSALLTEFERVKNFDVKAETAKVQEKIERIDLIQAEMDK